MSISIPTEQDIRDIFREETLTLLEKLETSNRAAPVRELMTKAELADYLRCNISKINRYMAKGLPFEQFGANPLFRKSAIDEWLKNSS